MSDDPISANDPTIAPQTRLAAASVGFVWHPLLNEERDDSNVLPSERLRQAYHLLEVTGILHWREIKTITSDMALGKPEALRTFHTPHYYQSVLAMSERRANTWNHGHAGLNDNDNQAVSALNGTVTLAGASVATTRSAVRYALEQPTARVFTPAGQQPHAAADHAEDGHIFNDVLLPLKDARAADRKVAFVNLDAEHPALIQQQFETDKEFLFISLHEHPSFLYPYTGVAKDIGKGAGVGYSVNLPMPPGAGDVEYQFTLDALVLPLLEQFAPDVLVVMGGTNAHFQDPSSHLKLTSKGYQATISALMNAAPRFVLFGGDGTAYDVAARLWAIALATLAERTNSLPPQIPAAHARLWSGGTFHDTQQPHLTNEYRTYFYSLLRADFQQVITLLQQYWQSLEMPAMLDVPRERVRVERSAGETLAFQAKDLHLPFGGRVEDEDDDTRRLSKPKATSRDEKPVGSAPNSNATSPQDPAAPSHERRRRSKGDNTHYTGHRPTKYESSPPSKSLSRHRTQPRHSQDTTEPRRDTPPSESPSPSATPPRRPHRARPRRDRKP